MTEQTQAAPELIRGNVKASMKAVNAGSSDLWNVPPSAIRFMDGFNVRVHNTEYEAHIEAIKESIIANGFYADKPIAAFVVEQDGEQIIFCTDGHSRVTAALRAIKAGAPLETIPVVVKPRGTSMEDLTVALATSNEGRPLSPYEKGLVCKRLVEFNVSEATIAKRLNMAPQYVKNLLDLVAAPKAIREMVTSGKVSATAAMGEIVKHGSKAAGRLQEALKTAKAAGKGKVTAKHLAKPTTLKVKGTLRTGSELGSSKLNIVLNDALDVDLPAGCIVRVTISEPDDEL